MEKETYTISASVINSYLYMKRGTSRKTTQRGRDKVKKLFIENTLMRKPLKMNFALNRGNHFEETIVKSNKEVVIVGETDNKRIKGSKPFLNMVSDCNTNVIVAKDVILEDEEFDIKMRGRLDFLSEDKKYLYDTKRIHKFVTKGSSTTYDKFERSVQHLFYMWMVPESATFYYLIGAGEDWEASEYHEIKYSRSSLGNIELRCKKVIREFIQFLKKEDLLELYKDNFKFYEKKKKEVHADAI